MTGRQMLIETRRLLDAGTFTTDGAGELAVDVADPAFTDAEIGAALTRAKRRLFRRIAARASANLLARQDITYPADAATVRLAPPGGLLSRPIYSILRAEDLQIPTRPYPLRRVNWNDLHIYRYELGNSYQRGYAERGGEFAIVPTPGSDMDLRIHFIPGPTAVDVTSVTEDEEVPPVAFDWLVAMAARDAATKFGAIPAALSEECDRAERDTMSALLSREEGPAYGRWTRGDYSTGLE